MRTPWKLLPALMVAAVLAHAPAAFAERRVALVIGNDAYAELDPLKKAVADATSFAALLEEKAFDKVILRTNVSGTAMDDAIAEFIEEIQPGDLAVFFYSGHGWSDGTQNFLIPTDVPKVTTEALLVRRSIPLQNGANGVIDEIARRGATLKVVIIDACRFNPFTAQVAGRSIGLGRGLSRVDAPSGTFVLFSAGAGQEALDRLSDSDADPNSVFTRTLLPRLRADMPLLDAVKEVQSEVYELAGRISHAQEPAYYDQVRGDVCLSGSCRRIAIDPPPPPDPLAEAFAFARELNTVAGWTAFLTGCEDGLYCDMARAAKENLEEVARLPPEPDPKAIAAEEAAQEAAAECDRLAASPYDQRKPTSVAGVEFSSVALSPEPAIIACRAAVAAFPDEVRYTYQLGRAFNAAKNYAEARLHYQSASDAGYAVALTALGLFYETGNGVAAASDSEAFRLYKRAAELNDPIGMYNLGLLYESGRGTLKDMELAASWFRRSADTDYSRAQSKLGYFYEKGIGLPQDLGHAAEWYRKAAAAGNAVSMRNLGILYEDGRGVPQDYSQAMDWYRKAAEAGSAEAMHDVGRMHRSGIGRAKDLEEARRWFERGAAANGRSAMFALALALNRGDGGARDVARAAGLYAAALRAGYQFGIEQFRTKGSTYPVEARRAVQQMLIDEGYLQGSADGVIGAATKDALARLAAAFPE